MGSTWKTHLSLEFCVVSLDSGSLGDDLKPGSLGTDLLLSWDLRLVQEAVAGRKQAWSMGLRRGGGAEA